MTFSIKRRPKRTGVRKISLPLFLPVLALVVSLLTGLSGAVRRQLETAAADQAETLLSEAASAAIADAFSGQDGIVTVTRADDGTITSVTTAPGALSALSAAYESGLREALASRGSVTVPAGNLTGSAWLSGRGVPITFRTVLSHATVTDIRSEFRAVGINQTLHRVIIETRTAVTVLLPGRNVTREIVRSFPAAETVIVGRVPDVVLQPGQ